MLPRTRYSLDDMIPWIILAAMNPTLKAVLFAAFLNRSVIPSVAVFRRSESLP